MVTCSFNIGGKTMAINNVIDLDAKLSLIKSVKIAGKVYEVQISDEIDKTLTDLTTIDIPDQLKNMTSKLEKMDEDDNGAKEFKEFTQSEMDELKDKAVTTLDVILGSGEGNRVYNFYNKSTKALFTIIGLLEKELREVVSERSKTAKKHYKNNRKK